jgi:hypothetical protein
LVRDVGGVRGVRGVPAASPVGVVARGVVPAQRRGFGDGVQVAVGSDGRDGLPPPCAVSGVLRFGADGAEPGGFAVYCVDGECLDPRPDEGIDFADRVVGRVVGLDLADR